MDKISAHVGLPSALIFSSTSSGEARGKSSIKLDTKPHHTSLTPSPCRLDLAPACSPDVHGTSPEEGACVLRSPFGEDWGCPTGGFCNGHAVCVALHTEYFSGCAVAACCSAVVSALSFMG